MEKGAHRCGGEAQDLHEIVAERDGEDWENRDGQRGEELHRGPYDRQRHERYVEYLVDLAWELVADVVSVPECDHCQGAMDHGQSYLETVAGPQRLSQLGLRAQRIYHARYAVVRERRIQYVPDQIINMREVEELDLAKVPNSVLGDGVQRAHDHQKDERKPEEHDNNLQGTRTLDVSEGEERGDDREHQHRNVVCVLWLPGFINSIDLAVDREEQGRSQTEARAHTLEKHAAQKEHGEHPH